MSSTSRRRSRRISQMKIYDALQQGDTLERLGGLRVLRIDGEVFVNGEKINSPHRPALDALATI